MRDCQVLVGDFMDRHGHMRPMGPSPHDCLMRLHLIQEETAELAKAMFDKDRVEIADALGDLLYVVLGCANQYQLDMEPIFREIHRSNMTKPVSDVRVSDKTGYSPANLKGLV